MEVATDFTGSTPSCRKLPLMTKGKLRSRRRIIKS